MPSSDRPAKSSSAPNKRQITIVDDLPVNDPMSHKPSADQHTGSALTGLAHAASIGPVLPDQGMKIPPDPPKRLVTIVGDTPKHTQSTTPLAATPRTNCAPPAGLTPTSAASAPAGSSDLDNSKTKGNTKKPTPEKIRRRARIAQAAATVIMALIGSNSKNYKEKLTKRFWLMAGAARRIAGLAGPKPSNRYKFRGN